MAAALPSNPLPASITEDVFRRLSPNGDIFAVSKDCFCARTIINLYDEQFHVFAPDERTRIADKIAQMGRYSVHVGWHELLKAKDGRSRAFRDFVAGPVREFVRSCRAVREPKLKKDADLWPLWDEGLDRGWHCLEARPGGVGNALRLRIRIPPYGQHLSSINIVATMRGHLPLAKARRLAAPLKIKAGLMKFLPDVAMVVPGPGGRETFAKARALRVMFDGAGFKASVLTSQITEEVSAMADSETFPVGRRVGLLHLLPGGTRVASVVSQVGAFAHRAGFGQLVCAMKNSTPRSDHRFADFTALLRATAGRPRSCSADAEIPESIPPQLFAGKRRVTSWRHS